MPIAGINTCLPFRPEFRSIFSWIGMRLVTGSYSKTAAASWRSEPDADFIMRISPPVNTVVDSATLLLVLTLEVP